MKSYSFVDDVRYGEEWIEKLYRLRNIAGIAGLVLGLAFAAVSVIIIGATIRMAVLARAKEISIMRLVGATDGYIRRPFLIEGFAKGVLGGLLALVLTWVAQSLINRYVIETIFFDARVAFARPAVRRADRAARQRRVRREAPTPGVSVRGAASVAASLVLGLLVARSSPRRARRAVGGRADPRAARGARAHPARARGARERAWRTCRATCTTCARR